MTFEFILRQTLHIVIFLEGIAAITSFIFLRNSKNEYIKNLPILLCLLFLIEILSVYIFTFYNKSIPYNILSLITFNYFFWLYRNSYVNTKHIRVSNIAILFVNAAYMSEFILRQAQNISLVYAYTLGGVFMIILTSLYFVQKLENEGELLIKQDVLFWISAGNLLFYVGYLPIKLARMFFSNMDNQFIYLQELHLILIILLNLCYIFGFKWAQMNS